MPIKVKKIAKGRRMDDSELRSVLQAAWATGKSYNQDGQVSEDRQKALRYLRGEPFGNERKGRSSYVSRDVQDTIETLLPELIEIFVGGEDVIKANPTRRGAEREAEQATKYCNYVFNRDNQGFKITYEAFKDALTQKNGIGKVIWEEREEKKHTHLRGLNAMEVTRLMESGDVEVEEQSVYTLMPDPETGEPREVEIDDTMLDGMPAEAMQGVLFDLKVCYYAVNGRNAIYNVPPENFGISPRARGLTPSPDFCYDYDEIPATDLLRDYPECKAQIDSLGGFSSLDWGGEQINRYADENYNSQAIVDESMRKILKIEWYIRVDCDGDGQAELRRIVTAGAEMQEILENEEVDDNPYFDFCPILEPHKFYGTSLADLVMHIQDIKSTITRQLLDNMYQANNKRYWYLEGQVKMQELLDSRPNTYVGVKQPNAVGELPQGSLSGEGLTMVQYFDQVREQTTGVYRSSRGLDADRLHDTARGMAELMDKQDKRTMLIARIFAECGFTRIFRIILANSAKYMTESRMIEIAGDWVEVDPRTWDMDMTFSIQVGLGTGDRQETIARAQQFLALLREYAAANPGSVTPQQAYNAFVNYMRATGMGNTPSVYVTDPASPEFQPPQPQLPEKVIIAQMDDATKRYEIDTKYKFEMWKASEELRLAELKIGVELATHKDVPDQKFGGSPAT